MMRFCVDGWTLHRYEHAVLIEMEALDTERAHCEDYASCKPYRC